MKETTANALNCLTAERLEKLMAEQTARLREKERKVAKDENGK